MGKTVRASKQFSDNFKIVSEYYACTTEEIEKMTEEARKDIGNAEISFDLMANEIKVKQ